MHFIPGIINAVRITQQDVAVPFSVFVFNPSVSTAIKQAQRDSELTVKFISIQF